MSKFAKLFEFDDIGQVLVKRDEGDGGPEVSLFFMPKGFGVCENKLNFSDDAERTADQKADHAFESIDRDRAEKIIRKVLETIPTGLAAE